MRKIAAFLTKQIEYKYDEKINRIQEKIRDEINGYLSEFKWIKSVIEKQSKIADVEHMDMYISENSSLMVMCPFPENVDEAKRIELFLKDFVGFKSEYKTDVTKQMNSGLLLINMGNPRVYTKLRTF